MGIRRKVGRPLTGDIAMTAVERARKMRATPRGRFKAYKTGARVRGLCFLLTFKQFKQIMAQPCLYCGEDRLTRGIDRWENNLGYTLENSRPCCRICNRMKWSMDCQEFVDHIQRAAEHTNQIEQSELQEAYEAEVYT
jgi:hypothetical protein